MMCRIIRVTPTGSASGWMEDLTAAAGPARSTNKAFSTIKEGIVHRIQMQRTKLLLSAKLLFRNLVCEEFIHFNANTNLNPTTMHPTHSAGHLTFYVLLGGTIGGGLGLGGLIGGPQGEVVAEQLHDEGGILVGLLRQSVELGDGIVEGLLGDVAGAVGAVEDLVVEDGEVEGKAEAMPEAAW